MKKPNTIVLVIEGTYPWYRGGVSEWVHRYIAAFTGYRFHLLQVATDPYLHTDFSHSLYDIPAHIKRFERIPPPDLAKEWKRESIQWLQDVMPDAAPLFETADLVHVANTGFAGWLGQQMAEKFDLPLVLTEHALYWKEVAMGAVALECGYRIPDNDRDKQRVSGWFREMAAGIYRAADTVISVSRCNIAEQCELGAEEVQYIPNGVPVDWLQEEKVGTGELCVGWVGRCAEMKNPLRFFELVEAFRENYDSPVRFLMMLSDANEHILAESVKQRAARYPEVQLVWNQPAREWYRQMDALCISSHNESQPLVLFEALAARVLPIGWQAGDVTPEYGLIVDQETPATELAQNVVDLWKDRAGWQGQLEARHRDVCRNHTWGRIFDQYRILFDRLPVAEAGRA